MYSDLDKFNELELEFGVDSFTDINLIAKNEEINKRLKERKLVEESDLSIAEKLFGNNENENVVELPNENKKCIKPIELPKKFDKKQYNNNNVLKQKELSKIKREEKENMSRHSEIYGECSEDKHLNYENKYNN